MRHVFGPVPSRRLGASLGLDLVRPKTCTFDCVYCQLGRTTCLTTTRDSYVPYTAVLEELRRFLEGGGKADYVTLSGSGEPTLSTDAGGVLRGAKALTGIPTAVLTNSSLLSLEEVREDLKEADLVVPSLDAAREESFRRVNRPHPDIRPRDLIDGLRDFRRDYGGEMWLEVMIVRGMNDEEADLAALSDSISRVDPERIQINTVMRPPAEPSAGPQDPVRLREIARYLGGEVVPDFSGSGSGKREELRSKLISLLARRPCTLEDLSAATGLHRNEILKYLRELEIAGTIARRSSGGSVYYTHQDE